MAGSTLAALFMVQAIFRTTNSTSAISLLFVPFYAAAWGLPALAVGFCLGYLRTRLGVADGSHRWITIAVAVIALSIVAVVSFLIAQRLRLVRQVHQVLVADQSGLQRVMEDSELRENKFILGAVAQNPNATPNQLHQIVTSPDPELHRRMGSVFDLMGANRKGLAVMRLVARHPNVAPEDVEALAGSPDEMVVGDVAANEKASEVTLRRLAGRGGYLMEWGIARNPKAPPDLLEQLGASANEYTRAWVASNPGTPVVRLERLSQDSNWNVRRGVAANPRAPEEIVALLANDPDDRVSRIARLRGGREAPR